MANSKQQTANSKQRTANSEQRTANSEQRTANGILLNFVAKITIAMRKILPLLAFVIVAHSLFAQRTVRLYMDQRLGEAPFTLDEAATATMGYAFDVTRLQYYLSGFELLHDGGITALPDLYLLVNPTTDTEFELGDVDLDHINSIRFSIGVDLDHNHLDPATYPSDHPLALQDPSMHWGWAGGYRFIAFEGQAGATEDSIENNYQIHTVGDQNYFSVTIDVDAEVTEDEIALHLIADYTKLLEEIDISDGMLNHGATGAAKKLAQNLRDYVFTAVITGIEDEVEKGMFTISPNPVSDYLIVKYDFPGYDNLSLVLHDLMGRKVYEQELSSGSQELSLEGDWMSGVYCAQIMADKKILGVEKLIKY